jgi:nuclear transcription factor Y gamma
MVQAAAQAQAVVAATKARGDLVPMSAQEIGTLSQKQAKAIVNARQQSSGTTLTESECKSQIQLQAQALVHAHTQAQIQAGIYKDGDGATGKRPAPSLVKPTAALGAPRAPVPGAAQPPTAPAPPMKKAKVTQPFQITPAQMQKQNALTKTQNAQRAEMQKKHRAELATIRTQFQKEKQGGQMQGENLTAAQAAQLNAAQERHNKERNDQTHYFRQQMAQLQNSFRQEHQQQTTSSGPSHMAAPNMVTSAPVTAGSSIPGTLPAPPNVGGTSAMSFPGVPAATSTGMMMQAGVPTTSPADQPDSPEFLQHLQGQLTTFWKDQLGDMHKLPVGTEHDFKNHNDLPLARIKRIMKSDEDVRMISAEAPVLFAKACEMFILELTLRSWNYSESNKRRTLQKEDIQTAIKKTDIFDFLVDVIN